MPRSLITLFLASGSLMVVLLLYATTTNQQDTDPAEPPIPATQPADPDAATQPAEDAPITVVDADAEADPVDTIETPDTVSPVPPIDSLSLGTLSARQVFDQTPPVIGSAQHEDNEFNLQAEFTPWGAGIKSIQLARYSTDPLEHHPYTIQQRFGIFTPGSTEPAYYYYPFAASRIIINEQHIDLFNKSWQITSDPDPATNDGRVDMQLVIESVDAAGQATPIATIRRTYTLQPNRYEIHLAQSVENLTDAPLQVELAQFGPGDLGYQASYLGDRRSVNFGYNRADDNTGRVYIEYETGIKRKDAVEEEDPFLWDARLQRIDEDTPKSLTFAAMTNRYFIAAVTPDIPVPTDGQAPVSRHVDDAFPYISKLALNNGGLNGHDKQNLLLTMQSGSRTVETGQSLSLDVALYAGPKDPALLKDDPVYKSIGLHKLVIYNIGGCCSFLTFGWLGEILLSLLHFFHMIVRDWGIAILLLTVIVRLILHPVTKKSQLNMMRFSKQMQTLQPEVEKLKKKHKDDSQKLNQEMMKLYREKGVNPAGMAMGCFPMFLQMPIWIALYAMLFFAIELRHQPAFYDAFHRIAESFGTQWNFLTDLSSEDKFIPLGAGFTIPFVGWHISHLNILPILMMFVFLVQQKLMQPPTTTELSDQAKQQQKIMKFMMLLFPIFLYKAPSGLTLYMLASSVSGIIDSKIVRRKLKQMEEAGEFDKPPQRKAPKPGGFLDRMQKAAEARQKELAQRQQQAQKGGGSGRKRKR